MLYEERSQTLAGVVLPAKLWWVRGGVVMGLSY